MRIIISLMILLGIAFSSASQQEAISALDALSRQQHYEARRNSSSNEDLARNGDARGIDAGGTLVLMDEDGPGVITHFWNTVGSEDPFVGQSLVLRVYYDGSATPSVESPLGDFFGVGHAACKDYTSLPVTVSSRGRSRVCFWRMPFRQHIKVTVTNESTAQKVDSFYYYLDWQKHERLPEDTAYFHARYKQAMPAQPGRYVILDTKGRGHYVGTVYSVFQLETGWFGEGDDFFFIDGAELPQLRGTGTEDYFNDAWGFREFAAPYHGVTLYEGVLTGDRVTAYRWHIQDPVPFKESLRLEIEHRGSIYNEKGNIVTMDLGSFEERPDWISSVAFWYQYPPAVIEEPMPPLEKRLPPYRVLKGSELTFRANPPILVVPLEPFVGYIPNTKEASIEFDFDLEKDGRYRIDGAFLASLMCGIYQPFLDGKKIGGPIDFVIPNFDPIWLRLDTHDLTSGTHVLRFESMKEDSPNMRDIGFKFNAFGLAGLTLLRLDDMEGYQQVKRQLLEKKNTPANP